MRAAGPEAGTSVKLFAHDLKAYVFGDVNGDLAVNCSDLSAASASVGKRAGQAGFSVGADIDQNGVVDVRDISGISRLLPVGTRC